MIIIFVQVKQRNQALQRKLEATTKISKSKLILQVYLEFLKSTTDLRATRNDYLTKGSI
jgi:Holliday junction resolvase-like predicted endonuclease